MVNIWEYANTLPYLTVGTTDGAKFTGKVIGVFDSEEIEEEEDSLVMELSSGRIISFLLSEIKMVQEMEISND